MNIPNPAQVHANRTARLVKEAKTPKYTSETPKVERRPHLQMVEVEDAGGRYWSGPFKDYQIEGVCADYERYGSQISDIDCTFECWCVKEGVYGK
jgi:hypothetical protein